LVHIPSGNKPVDLQVKCFMRAKLVGGIIFRRTNEMAIRREFKKYCKTGKQITVVQEDGSGGATVPPYDSYTIKILKRY
jgi:hypothetical protein